MVPMICGRSPARTRSLVAGHSRIADTSLRIPRRRTRRPPVRGIVRPLAARAAQDRDPTVAVEQCRETFEIVSRRRYDRRGRQQPLDLRRRCVARRLQRHVAGAAPAPTRRACRRPRGSRPRGRAASDWRPTRARNSGCIPGTGTADGSPESTRCRSRPTGDAVSPKAHRPCHFAEVPVLQVRVHRQQAGCLLLYVDKPELAVVIDDDLDRQVHLHRRQQVTEQHGEPAIACQTNHLPARLALLQSERRWHPTSHCAMEQAGKGSAFAAGVDVAKHPDCRCPVVRCEQCVFGRVLVDSLGQVSPGNGSVGARYGFSLRRCQILMEARHIGRQEAAIFVLFKAR